MTDALTKNVTEKSISASQGANQNWGVRGQGEWCKFPHPDPESLFYEDFLRNWPLCQQQLLGSRRRILAGLFLAAVNALELIAERPREKQFLARSLVEATRGHAQPGGGDSRLPTTFLQRCFRLVLFGRQRTSRCRETDSHRRPKPGRA